MDGDGRGPVLCLAVDDLTRAERYVGDGLGVAAIVGAYYQLDDVDDPRRLREIELSIVDACRALAR